MIISPRKQVAKSNLDAARTFPIYQFPRNLGGLAAKEGRVLSRWGDAGWGKIVAANKHSNSFSDELVNATAEMITQRWKPIHTPTWVCCVPSINHPDLVPDFARKLSQVLGLHFFNVVKKIKDNDPQKLQQNSFHQCRNLDGAFSIEQPIPDGPVLLIDDIIDSGWTLTVIAALLLQSGSGPVLPLALASTSASD